MQPNPRTGENQTERSICRHDLYGIHTLLLSYLVLIRFRYVLLLPLLRPKQKCSKCLSTKRIKSCGLNATKLTEHKRAVSPIIRSAPQSSSRHFTFIENAYTLIGIILLSVFHPSHRLLSRLKKHRNYSSW